jgi:hypothetical protein
MSFAIISLYPDRGANGKTSLIGKFRHSSVGPARNLFAIWTPTRKDFDGANPNVVARSDPLRLSRATDLGACRCLARLPSPACRVRQIWGLAAASHGFRRQVHMDFPLSTGARVAVVTSSLLGYQRV